MGTALTGNTISSSYLGLIKTTDSAAISSSAKRLTDGAGNDSPLYLSTSRLGIGITPTSTLHVSGDFTLTGAFKDTSGDAGTSGQILSSTGSGTNWIDNDVGDITSVVAGDGLTGGGTSGDVTLNVGAGNLIDVQADQIDVDLSELTTSTSDGDGDFFAVVDDANAQKKLTKANINLSGFNNDLSIPTVSGTTNKIAKFTASTTVGDSVITEVSSEIGINIASPQEILHQHIGSSSTNYHQFTNSTTGSAVNNGLLVGINSAGEAQILNKLNSANAKIRLATYAGTTIMDLNGNIEADNGSNGDQYLRISNDDSGTAVQSTIYVSNSGANADGLFAGVLGTSFTTASGFVQDGVAIGSGTGASGGLSIMTRAAADMRFYTNGHTNERMRITSAGNVGINQTSPGSFFANASQLVIGDGTTSRGMTIYSSTGGDSQIFFADGTSGDAQYRGILRYEQSSDAMVMFTAATERMRIDDSGNVGIGRSPVAYGSFKVLDLAGSSGAIQKIIHTGSTVELQSYASSTTGAVGTATNHPLIITTNDSTALKITDDQQVELHGVAGADGFTLPYDQNPGYSNFSAGGFGFVFREAHDSYLTHNLYYYKTGGAASWRYKYTAAAGLMGMDSGDFYFRTVGSGSADAVASLTERMRFKNGGQLNIGTGSLTQTAYQLRVDADTDDGVYISAGSSSSNHSFYVENAAGSTPLFVVRGDGAIGIGGAAVGSRTVSIYNSSANNELEFIGTDYTNIYSNTTSGFDIGTVSTAGASYLRFLTENALAMYIGSNGNVGIGATSHATYRLLVHKETDGDWLVNFYNSHNGDGNGLLLDAGDGSSGEIQRWRSYDGSLRARCMADGDFENNNNSYGSTSDKKLKENIVDATPKLDDLCKVKIRNFNKIGDDKKQIGVVAQELEEVFPNMISESEDIEITEDGTTKLGTTTKSVKYSVFVPMLVKAIQELKAEIDELKKK
jgi:hypothetical protein